MKKLIIKIFGLTDISNIIYRACLKERRKSKEEFNKELQDIVEVMERDHELELQVKDSELALLEQQIYQIRVKHRDALALEAKSKRQVKANFVITSEISMQTNNLMMLFNKCVGEIEGLKDRSEQHFLKLT